MFADPTVGMTGAHKIPVNTPDHLVGFFTHLRLRMEHQLCLEIPRLGEMIAFRKVFDRIPPDVAMDEAFVEALVVQRGMQVRYAPDAVVYNTGPGQRLRFRPPAPAQLRRPSLSEVQVRLLRLQHAEHPGRKGGSEGDLGRLPVAVDTVPAGRAGVWSRLLGWYDFRIKRDRHVVWDMAWSQKADVEAARQQTQDGEDARPTAMARKT